MILECIGLSRRFDGVQALVDVSMAFRSVGLVGVLGPNGAGKTTLLNVLTGFLEPEAGRVVFAGSDIAGLSPHKIAALGIRRTFQDVRLIREMTVMENVILAGEAVGVSQGYWPDWSAWFRPRVSKGRQDGQCMLEGIGLGDLGGERAGRLSYGQQKLLTLGCCLAGNSRVLLLDEPVSGVDPVMKEHIIDVLSRLRDLDKLVVFVEHDTDTVRRVADSVIIMDEGRIIAAGPPAVVLNRPDIVEAYLA